MYAASSISPPRNLFQGKGRASASGCACKTVPLLLERNWQHSDVLSENWSASCPLFGPLHKHKTCQSLSSTLFPQGKSRGLRFTAKLPAVSSAFSPTSYHPVPRLPATATAVTKIIGTRPMLQNPADSKHGLSGAFNIVAHFLFSVAMALYSPGFCSFHPAASSRSPSLAPQPLPAPRRGPASGLCPGLPSHSPTASRRQPGFSSASSTPEELMFLTRAPSLAADWTHCLNVTCFSDSEYPNLHSPYPLSQWHHCLPKTNVNVGFSLPSI